MSNLTILGDTSGSVVLQAPAIAGSTTLTLPATSGTILTNRTPGTVLQVLSSPKTDAFTTTSGTYVDITGLSVSITPTNSSNKILILFSVNAGIPGDVMHGYLTLVRNSTEIFKADTAGSRRSATAVVNTATQQQFTYAGMYLDSPATTSATTYKIQALSSNGNTLCINRSARDTNLLDYDGRSVSSITVMEIAA